MACNKGTSADVRDSTFRMCRRGVTNRCNAVAGLIVLNAYRSGFVIPLSGVTTEDGSDPAMILQNTQSSIVVLSAAYVTPFRKKVPGSASFILLSVCLSSLCAPLARSLALSSHGRSRAAAPAPACPAPARCARLSRPPPPRSCPPPGAHSRCFRRARPWSAVPAAQFQLLLAAQDTVRSSESAGLQKLWPCPCRRRPPGPAVHALRRGTFVWGLPD